MQVPYANRKYVMLAEDDEDDCLFFQDALQEAASGTKLRTASNGEQLMELLDLTVPPKPDVIFLDLNMPRKNGFECLREIRDTEKLKDIPVVIFSTSGQTENIKATYDLGASIFVQKPDTFRRLIETIQKILSMDLGVSFMQPAFKNFVKVF